MATTYTTVQKVKDELENYDSSLTDDQIENFILNAEGLIDATMGKSFKDIFSSSKHRLIERCATKLALIDVIKWDLQNQFGSSIGSIQLDLAREDVNRCLSLLADPKVVKFLEGETK